MPLRVIFDTNVIISALNFTRGSMAWLRKHWQDGRCTPVSSNATVQELSRVLSYSKFRLSDERRIELLADYVPYCEIVETLQPCPVRCRDTADQPFLDLAHSASADILVTGDDDLLSLATLTTFKIETPAQYQQRFPNS